MNLDEIFNIEAEEEKPIKMSISDFVDKTRVILEKIDREYSTAHQWKRIDESEYETQDCDNCKGECKLIRNGLEHHCVPDKSEGECFVMEFQYETFIEEFENIVFHDEKYSFYDLLNCEVITSDWISIEDRLPEIGQKVITYRPLAKLTGDEKITIQNYVGGQNTSPQGFTHGFDRWCHPTHWMPLIKKP